jgi:predicted transposase YbfD/YdcC
MASQNHYLIAIKGNQPKLLAQIQPQFEHSSPLSCHVDSERTRNRSIQRRVCVLEPSATIDPSWVGLKRVIRVERTGLRAGIPVAQTVFYISSLATDAAEFARRIRQHWHIENRLHWCKDVVLKEDTTPLCEGHALINMAIVRTFALNLFRQHGFDSLTQAIRQVAHDIPRLFSFCQ